MTSKIVVNNIESDTGISSVTFTSDIELGTKNLKGHNLESTGIITATSFVGSGANLTNIPAGNLTGTASGNPTLSGGVDNRVITASSATALTGESNVNINGGILIAGHTASTTVSDGEGPFIQVKSTDSRGGISLLRHSANAAGGGIYIGKSRNATIGSNTVLQNGDELGRITFSGDDGTDIHTQAAAIHAFVDGTTGSNDMPGSLKFYTNSGSGNGSSDLAERLRIRSSGKVNIGDTQMSSNILNVEDGTAAAIDIASHGTGGDTAYIGVKKSAGGGLTFGISNRDFIFNRRIFCITN